MTQILLSSNGMIFLCGSLSHQNVAMFSTHSLKRNPDNPIQFKSQKHPILPFILELFHKLNPISPFFFIYKRSSPYSYFASLLQFIIIAFLGVNQWLQQVELAPLWLLLTRQQQHSFPLSYKIRCALLEMISFCFCFSFFMPMYNDYGYCMLLWRREKEKVEKPKEHHFLLLCLNPPHYDFTKCGCLVQFFVISSCLQK